MAKKWSKKEINEYLGTKQISQDNYVAPTVRVNTRKEPSKVESNEPTIRSIESTVNTLNSVKNNKPKSFEFTADDKKQPSLGNKLGFVAKSGGAGLTSGLTGLVDAPLQNMQEGAKKGKNKSNLENYVKGALKTLDIYGISNIPEIVNESSKIIQDKNKKGWEKALNIGGAILNNNPIVNSLEASGQQMNILNKNAEKDIAKTRQAIETPSNKLNEKVQKESQNMGKGWQLAGEVNQTIGNMLPSMAATAITKNPNIGLAAMGVSVKGQATKEAEDRGANLNEANQIGLAKGLTEVGTETLTGGLKFLGKGSADDLVEKGINKIVKNKTGNFVAKQLAGIGGEIGEETISDLVGTAIDKATVDPDATYTFDDWKRTALTTMLSTGALNTISGGYSKQAYQLNAEELEQIVQNEKVQKAINERVEQLTNPNMTPQEVAEIRQEATEVILGEIQQNVDDIIDSAKQEIQQPQIPTQTPLNTLNQGVREQNVETPYQTETPQITPLNQVNQELQETRKNDIADSVQAMNLEKQPEFKQKQGNYVYEKHENPKIDTLRQDIARHFTDSEETRNFAKTLEKIIEDKNVDIRFNPNLRDSQGRIANGSYSNGVITLNPNSNRAGEFLTIHELTHAIGTKPMIKMIENYRKSNAEFNNAVEKLLGTYNATEINEEALADISGQLFGNQEYINKLSTENKNLFNKLYNEIKYLWHQLRGYKNQNEFIEDLYHKWDQAYRRQNIKNTNKTGYSINGDGRDFFYRGQQKEGTDLSYNDTQFQGSEDDGYYFTPNKKTANKYGKNIIERFRDENNTVTVEESDRLQEMATKKLEEHMKEGKWYEEDDLLEQMALGRSKAFAEYTGKPFVETGDMFGEDAEAVYYPEFDKDTKYSIEEVKKEPIKDNTGRELSKQQQEYFKDSKVRDENGNLLKMYHGTPNGNFTVFNPGSYFSSNQNYASNYQDENASILKQNKGTTNKKTYETYLNIKNPFELSNEKARDIYINEFIKGGNSEYFDPYTSYNDYVKQFNENDGFEWLEAEELKEWIQENHPEFDGLVVQEVPDNVDPDAVNLAYIPFNPNQIKNVDNLNPTNDPDIRYSKDNQTWKEYLEKEFPSQGTRTDLQGINERNKPKQENKTIQEEKPQEMPKNEVKQEVKKSYLTTAEQNELENLRELDNTGLLDEKDADYKRLQELERKSQGITTKYPELKVKNTFDDIKSIYGKYKNSEISKENNKVLNEAKNFIEANKQGRRTKEQWLQVAEFIGNNADIKSSQDLQQLAMETWFETKPNNSNVLNRQGQKYVKFPVNEWVDAVYKGAGVGTDIKMSKEENTINENKQEDKIVLRTPTKIIPKEIKTPKQQQEYFEESGTPKKVAKILSETPRETETSNLREKYQMLKRAVVDKGEAIYRISKQTKNRKLYAMYDRIGLATGEANYNIGDAQTSLDGTKYNNFTDAKGKKTSMSLKQIWDDAEKSGVPENVMNEYLAHYLNIDRYKSNQLSMEESQELKDLKKYKNLSKVQKERLAELEALSESRNVFGEAITREDSRNKVKEIEYKYPQIKRSAENIWQYGRNQLQNMVDAGLVSKESQEYYNETTPHYVRIQRVNENNKNSIFDKNGHLQVNNQIKKAKGGTKDIIPFKDSMAQYTLDTVSSIRKNLFGQELGKTLNNGLDIDENIDIDNLENNILNKNDDGSYTFKIYKDGKPEILTIDKGIYEALQPNKHYDFEKIFTPFRVASNLKRGLLTDKNPLFLVSNFFKDVFDAPLNTKHSTVDFVKNYGEAVNQIITNGEYFQKYKALGGNQNTYFDREGFNKDSAPLKEQYNKISGTKDALKFGFNAVLTPIEKGNNFIETLPRLSEFITSVKKGESLDEAMYNAAEITTNFKRGGTATKLANRNGATFLNASVQGFDKQIRNFAEIQNPKQATRLLAKGVLLGIAPALLNAVMYDDDDEYEDLPDYIKDSYYLFKTDKDNKWIRIPKGRAISVIQAAARRTYDYSKGNKDAYKGLIGHFTNQLAPNNPLDSNVLSPFIDVANNKSWSGSKIVSDSIANETHPEEEYDAKTDEFSKWLGKKLGKSPKKINYILDQTTGGIGDLALPFLTKQAEGEDESLSGRILKNPIRDKFTTDAVLNSKQVNQFYDAFNKAEDDKKWSKATDDDKLRYKYLYSTMLTLADYNKQIKEIESSNKSDKDKYKETKELKQEMNEISRKAVKESKNIDHKGSYAQIGNNIYKKEYDKETGEHKYTKVPEKQLEKLKSKGVSLVDYFNEAYERQKIRATK